MPRFGSPSVQRIISAPGEAETKPAQTVRAGPRAVESEESNELTVSTKFLSFKR